MAQLVERDVCKPWDLGSIPRSPYIFHAFSINMLLCSVPSKDYHATSLLNLPRAQEVQSNGYQQATTMYVSQLSHISAGKVNVANILMGQNSSNHTSNWANSPPLVCICIFLFLVLILSLFFCLLYYFN